MAQLQEQSVLTVQEQQEITALTAECLDEKGKPKKGVDFKKLTRLKELMGKIKTAPPAAEKKGKEEYSFPTKSVCPRCRSLQTKAVSTQGKVQYRQCQMPVCHWNYTVLGEKL
jgi:hypothetical protein